MPPIEQTLFAWLKAGGELIGEIRISPEGSGFALCHGEDFQRADLEIFADAEVARRLANFDRADIFRPLKTAPNLRRGWKLILGDVHELRRALDYFYPAMIGLHHSHRRGDLVPVRLRETLGRQSGMYAVTKKVTDQEANEVVGRFCKTDGGCLKRILWPIAPGVPITSLAASKFSAESEVGEMPLLCHEACNLLVAKIREEVRKPKGDSG